MISRIQLSFDPLFQSYIELLLKAFSVERQIEVYLPIHYGSMNVSSSESKLNVNLIEYYFDEQVPSLFTCLFNKNPSQFECSLKEEELLIQLTNRLDACPSLLLSVSIERLVLLDKYYKAKQQESILEECHSIALSLCEHIFSPQLVHYNEVSLSFYSFNTSAYHLIIVLSSLIFLYY